MKKQPKYSILTMRDEQFNIFPSTPLFKITNPIMHQLLLYPHYGPIRRYYKLIRHRFNIRRTLQVNHSKQCKNQFIVLGYSQLFFDKQKYRYSRWCTGRLMKIEGNKHITRKVFKALYIDRNLRYDLYFTQGIVDPFGPEADTWIALTK